MASLQLACALFALIPLDWFGILLGIEGLTLVYFGYRYQAYYLRLEGYFIYIIALFKLTSDVVLADWFTIDFHLFNALFPLFSLVSLLWCCVKLNQIYDEEQKSLENKITYYSNEGISLASYSIWSIVCLTYSVYWLSILGVPLVIWLIWRNRKYALNLTEWLAYSIPIVSLFGPAIKLTNFSDIILTSNNIETAYYWLDQSFVSWLSWVCIIISFSLFYQLSRIDSFKLKYLKLSTIYQGVAYSIIPVFLISDIINLAINYFNSWETVLVYGDLWTNFLINLLIITGLLYIFTTHLKSSEEKIYKKYKMLLAEPLAIGLAVFFYIAWLFLMMKFGLIFQLSLGLYYCSVR